jgi:hypothetical protein
MITFTAVVCPLNLLVVAVTILLIRETMQTPRMIKSATKRPMRNLSEGLVVAGSIPHAASVNTDIATVARAVLVDAAIADTKKRGVGEGL